MPFNFLNSVNASILFFIVKSFAIEGKALSTDLFESALPQAYIDALNGEEVLLGVVNEAIADLDLHKEKFDCKSIEEHSRWLLLSCEQKEQKALATIEAFQLNNATYDEHACAKLFDFLEKGADSYSFKSRNLSFRVIKNNC